MSNQGWTNGSGDGVQTSSTARQSGRGTEIGPFDDFKTGERIADPGMHNDPLASKSDQFGPPGQLSVTKPS